MGASEQHETVRSQVFCKNNLIITMGTKSTSMERNYINS